jgi:hypothetical protein
MEKNAGGGDTGRNPFRDWHQSPAVTGGKSAATLSEVRDPSFPTPYVREKIPSVDRAQNATAAVIIRQLSASRSETCPRSRSSTA